MLALYLVSLQRLLTTVLPDPPLAAAWRETRTSPTHPAAPPQTPIAVAATATGMNHLGA